MHTVTQDEQAELRDKRHIVKRGVSFNSVLFQLHSAFIGSSWKKWIYNIFSESLSPVTLCMCWIGVGCRPVCVIVCEQFVCWFVQFFDSRPVFFNVQLTWTAHTSATMANIKPGEEVIVSYLPLSHVAAQMVDIWIGMRFAGTIYFAEPDALKVRMLTVV